MLNRWDPLINCINLALSTMHRLSQQVFYKRKGRGKKPERPIKNYAMLIALKEFDKRSLRGAETHLSRLVCKERIDHSVISYWENKEEMSLLIAKFIAVAGAMLDKLLSSLFIVVDSTKFTSWHIEEVEVHVCNRIAKGTVYPIGISFVTSTFAEPVNEAVPDGDCIAYLDAAYDVNDVFKVLFGRGYTPIICPNKNRIDGFYRRKGRKLYRMRKYRLGYRQRGRGESTFGSLTNCYGDRFHARSANTMKTRTAARILSYQIKILIRANEVKLLLIVRHAQ